MKRAQLAIEFLSLVAFSIVFFMVVVYGLVVISTAKKEESALVELFDFAKSVQLEFILAASVQDGYHTTVLVPQTFNGQPYDITILNTTRDDMLLEITYNEQQYYYRIPAVQGNIAKGTQLLEKHGGVLYLS